MTPLVVCKKEVIYKLPFTCGKVYVSHTRRCLNDRLREHRASLSDTPFGHLAIHCARCGGVPEFHRKEEVGSYRGKVARDILEVYQINKEGIQCVCGPILVLVDDGVTLLKASALYFCDRLTYAIVGS